MFDEAPRARQKKTVRAEQNRKKEEAKKTAKKE